MNKIMPRIIAIYSLVWLTVLVIIVVTLEEITFVIGLIVLIGLMALQKLLHIRSAHDKNQEALWGILFTFYFLRSFFL